MTTSRLQLRDNIPCVWKPAKEGGCREQVQCLWTSRSLQGGGPRRRRACESLRLLHRWMKLFLQLLSCDRIGHAGFFSVPASKCHRFWGGRNNLHWEVAWEIPPSLKSTCSLELSDRIFKDGSFSCKRCWRGPYTPRNSAPLFWVPIFLSLHPKLYSKVGVHHINAVTTVLVVIFWEQTDHLFN